MPCTLTILYGKTRGHMGADQAPRPPCTPRHAHAHQLHLSCTASRHPSLARSLLTYTSSLPFPPQEEERESPKPVTALILYGIPASTLPSSLPFPLQEEERERRLDYVPDESALNTNALEVRFLCVPRTIQVLQRIILGIYVVVVGTTAGWKPAAAAVPGPSQRQSSPRQALRRCSETRDQPQCRPDQSSTVQFMSLMACSQRPEPFGDGLPSVDRGVDLSLHWARRHSSALSVHCGAFGLMPSARALCYPPLMWLSRCTL